MSDAFNTKNFKEICETCDRVLSKSIEIKEVVAIPYLHVLREHPFWVENYYPIFNYKNIKHPIKNRRNTILKKIFLFAKEIFTDSNFSLDDLKEDIDFVTLSHLTNIKQLTDENDEYFGALNLFLNDTRNMKTLTVLINHTDYSSREIKDKISKKFLTIVLPKSLGLLNECKLIFKQIFITQVHKRRIKPESFIEERIIDHSLSIRNALGALSALRIGKLMKLIIGKSRAKYFFTTFEGHSRERIVFLSAREANSNIKCFAYQHSIISQYQHAIKRSIGKFYDPDKIYTCGNSTFEMLKNKSINNNSTIDVLGSPKHLSLDKKVKSDIEFTFLFLPEGIYSEYKLFYKFFTECSNKYKNYKFIWRSHPLLNIQDMEFFADSDFEYENTHISNDKIKNDIINSDFAFYRASTAIIPASAAGVAPIYIKTDNQLDIDILFPVKHLSIHNPLDLESVLDSYKHSNNSKDTMKFCQKYFTPIDFSRLSIS